MEPRLESLEDYNGLHGQKKKIVWGVIFIGVFLGALFNYFNATTEVNDALLNHQSYSKLPPKY